MKTKLIIALVLLGIFAIAALPAAAAPGAVILSISPNPAECYVDVTFQVEDAGPYFVTLYDDGALLAGGGGDYGAGGS